MLIICIPMAKSTSARNDRIATPLIPFNTCVWGSLKPNDDDGDYDGRYMHDRPAHLLRVHSWTRYLQRFIGHIHIDRPQANFCVGNFFFTSSFFITLVGRMLTHIYNIIIIIHDIFEYLPCAPSSHSVQKKNTILTINDAMRWCYWCWYRVKVSSTNGSSGRLCQCHR